MHVDTRNESKPDTRNRRRPSLHRSGALPRGPIDEGRRFTRANVIPIFVSRESSMFRLNGRHSLDAIAAARPAWFNRWRPICTICARNPFLCYRNRTASPAKNVPRRPLSRRRLGSCPGYPEPRRVNGWRACVRVIGSSCCGMAPEAIRQARFSMTWEG